MRIPIGISDFRELVTDASPSGEHYFYCDKSKMIEDLLNDGSKVILFTRPRRFGKTLNMSMLAHFFGNKEPLFDGLEIAQNQHIMGAYHGQYPVISISFKGLKHNNYQGMFEGLAGTIRDAILPFAQILNSPELQVYFDSSKQMTTVEFTRSLLVLSRALYTHYGQRAIILIDEYDAPIHTGYLNGYLEEITSLMRNLFEDGLKDNTALFKGVLTGITRVAKSNLFSGLNHFFSYDIDSFKYSNYFGFTEEDVLKICEKKHLSVVKEWYNGYKFGKTTIYNPWSILYFMNNNFIPKAYWIDTAENSLIQKSLSANKMSAVQTLINGGAISLKVDNNLILKHLESYKNAFFNLLYTAGYLTAAEGEGEYEGEILVRIPNKEVRDFFEDTVVKWFSHGAGQEFIKDFLNDLMLGNVFDLQTKFQQMILETMSFHDMGEGMQESFYHGFLLGLTLGLKGRYHVNSNRESGLGRYDVALYPKDPNKDPGIIIEVKIDRESAEKALCQIQDKAYTTELQRHGCKKILAYGLHFNGKEVTIQMYSQIS